MRTIGRLGGATLGIAVVALAIAAGSARAAIQVVELSRDHVTPGTSVTLRVAMTARQSAGPSSTLFLVAGGTAFDAGQSPTACRTVPGAHELTSMHWRAGSVEYLETSYPGFVGEATFVVPDVSPGAYYLAEELEAPATGCWGFALLTVVELLPNTAVPPPSTSLPAGVAALLLATGGALVIRHRLRRLALPIRSPGEHEADAELRG